MKWKTLEYIISYLKCFSLAGTVLGNTVGFLAGYVSVIISVLNLELRKKDDDSENR